MKLLASKSLGKLRCGVCPSCEKLVWASDPICECGIRHNFDEVDWGNEDTFMELIKYRYPDPAKEVMDNIHIYFDNSEADRYLQEIEAKHFGTDILERR